MGVILGADADANDDPTGCPLIGYDNLVTTTNVVSTTEATGFPISNVANPATHLKWQGGVNTGDEYVTISTGFSDTVSYLGIAKHNFGSAGIVASVEGNDPAQILLHFDSGGLSPDVIFDSNTLGSSHTWTAHGNANQATTTYKFGGTSLACDGTGDYVDTPDHADFVLGGNDFTIDVWLNCTAVANLQKRIAGQYTGLAGTTSWLMYRSTANVYRFVISDGSSVSTDYATTTVFHSVSNTGWHHFAVTRSGNTIRLFIDGTQEGGDHTFTGNVPDSPAVMEVGTAGNSEWWQGNIDEFRFLVGAAQWTANFTPPSTPYGWQELANGTEDATSVLLHFDGTDASTSIVDSNTAGRDHTWTAGGTLVLDTADSKFGGASLLCDATGSVSATLGADAYLGSGDFTIDLWFNCNAAGGTQKRLAGQYPTGVAAEDAWNIFRQTTNVIICTLSNGTAETTITGTTQFTSATNTGWHHLAFVRSGNTIKMFIDGVQEGGNVSFTGSVPSLSTTLVQVGEFGGSGWVGWLDEFRMTIGTARWTTTGFTVPSTADSGTSAITTDDPIIFRWAPVPIAGVRLHMRPDAEAPEAAVIYVGELLVLERSIDINPKHVPITYGRRTNIVNGMSETGNFLGRVVLGEYRESKAEFEWFTPEFYRSDVDAFLDAAQEAPFFWAWSPDEYPAEVGFVWLTNNAEPEVDPVTRRIGLELQMRGIA